MNKSPRSAGLKPHDPQICNTEILSKSKMQKEALQNNTHLVPADPHTPRAGRSLPLKTEKVMGLGDGSRGLQCSIKEFSLLKRKKKLWAKSGNMLIR